MNISIAANYWGWNFEGVRAWLRYGWARPVATWGVEIHGSLPVTFQRRMKIGPVCFNAGKYQRGPVMSERRER